MKGIIVSEENFLRTYNNMGFAYKVLSLCKDKNWLPLKPSAVLASTVGHLMGDGNLSKYEKAGDFRFYGTSSKLDKIRIDLKTQFDLTCYRYYSHPKGGGYILRYNNCIFSRILELCGVPRGNKVLTTFKVPKWIMEGNKEIKKSFLSSIFADEMCRIYNKKGETWRGLEFGMSKDRNKIQSLVYFLGQLKKLLNDFNITSSKVKIKKSKIFYRKDGYITNQAVFSIHTNFENREKFYFSVGFSDDEKQKLLYSSLKLDKIDVGVPEWSN